MSEASDSGPVDRDVGRHYLYTPEHRALWQAINDLVTACGGSNDARTPRMFAAVKVSQAIEQLVDRVTPNAGDNRRPQGVRLID